MVNPSKSTCNGTKQHPSAQRHTRIYRKEGEKERERERRARGKRERQHQRDSDSDLVSATITVFRLCNLKLKRICSSALCPLRSLISALSFSLSLSLFPSLGRIRKEQQDQ